MIPQADGGKIGSRYLGVDQRQTARLYRHSPVFKTAGRDNPFMIGRDMLRGAGPDCFLQLGVRPGTTPRWQ